MLERGPRHRDGPVVVRHENVELARLAEPARRVTPDEQRLVVGVRVALGATVTQNREDGPQELVRDGADRALVASPNHQRLVVRPELAVVSPSGGMRALDEHRSQGLVPGPPASGTALAGTSVVPGTHAGPGCERRAAPNTAPSVPASINLAQADTQSIPRIVSSRRHSIRSRRQGVGNVPVERVHAPGKRVVFVQQVGEQHAIRFRVAPDVAHRRAGRSSGEHVGSATRG